MTCNGGLTVKATLSGTATIILGGGTWSGTSQLKNNLSINCTTAVISSSGVTYRDGTMTYVAGTITTTGSTLTLAGNCTLNIDGMPLNNLTTNNNVAVTLGSKLTVLGTFVLNNITTSFSGADISLANLIFSVPASVLSGYTLSIQAGRTLTITTLMDVSGNTSNTVTINSMTASTAYLNFTGAVSGCKVFMTTFSYIDASGSAQVIDNWYGGTLTSTTNITNRTSADIGGISQDIFGIL
jgi:hypothetical protein